MTDDKKKIVNLDIGQNSFELSLRILGNEFIAIKIGSTNFGGTALNGSDILFFTGTDDSKAYAIDAHTGKELWSFKMDSAGSTPPTIFEIDGKQYVTFLATGGNYHNYKDKSSSVYTFGIRN